MSDSEGEEPLKYEGPRRVGHLKVNRETGELAYKKVSATALTEAIQMGIRDSISRMLSRKKRDLLHTDFMEVEAVSYPREGSSITQPHTLDSFKFYSYAPTVFRYFQQRFSIKPEDFLVSMCAKPLRPLPNAGASGSLFYLSHDDVFIIKTVQAGEHEFFRKLLQGYYMNLTQNQRTLLPKFFGLFKYRSSLGRDIRLIVMNNLLPSHLIYHELYDLKGSSFKRKASQAELAKRRPTLKDLDFRERHVQGLRLDPHTYEKLVTIIQKDVDVLESFKIMDYSLLVGLHKAPKDLDAAGERHNSASSKTPTSLSGSGPNTPTYGAGATFFSSSTTSPSQPAKSPGATPGPKARDCQMNGCDIYPFLNGPYELLTSLHAGHVAYKRDIEAGLGPVSSVFIWFDRSSEHWVITTGVGSMDKHLATLPLALRTPASKFQWIIHDLESGNRVESKNMVFNDKGAGGSRGRPASSMSFRTLSQQLDTEPAATADDAPAQSSDAYEHGGIVAYDEAGERYILFIGIIDILQSYVTKKKLEHTWKALIHDAKTVSVTNPIFYAERFRSFMNTQVFTMKQARPVAPTERQVVKPSFRLGRAVENPFFFRRGSPTRAATQRQVSTNSPDRSDAENDTQSPYQATTQQPAVVPATDALAPLTVRTTQTTTTYQAPPQSRPQEVQSQQRQQSFRPPAARSDTAGAPIRLPPQQLSFQQPAETAFSRHDSGPSGFAAPRAFHVEPIASVHDPASGPVNVDDGLSAASTAGSIGFAAPPPHLESIAHRHSDSTIVLSKSSSWGNDSARASEDLASQRSIGGSMHAGPSSRLSTSLGVVRSPSKPSAAVKYLDDDNTVETETGEDVPGSQYEALTVELV
eukprot:m.863316 g.863316  ORF g.863316 m.863316 type:complete len:863 (-) comp59701_c0_seq1:1664-4252(-)